MYQEDHMDRVSDLRLRERRLRTRVTAAYRCERGFTPRDLASINEQLAEMRMILERHLAELPAPEREYEEYRLEFLLPVYSYMRRTLPLLFPEGVAG
jgi:hypothetical protein